MTSPLVVEIIQKAYPNARIISPVPDAERTLPASDAATPDTAALIKKYGGVSIGKPYPQEFDGCETVVVELGVTNPNHPKSLTRRTLIVDPVSGAIVGSSG